MKLAEDLYFYEWTDPYTNNCNSYYIGGSVQALIDPGLKKHLPDLLVKMSLDGIDGEKIRYIINTHSHPDHYEGSVLFNSTGATIALHGKEIEFLANIGCRMFEWFGLEFPQVDINLVLSEGDLELGNEIFRVILTPGHSPGSIGLYWPERQVLFSGDVIFDQNVGRSDFPGGDALLLKESIRKLAALDIGYCLPGHMGILQGVSNVKRNFDMVIDQIFPYI